MKFSWRTHFDKLKQLKAQQGFTMIELLIVIAILGILAIAVLSAINPIEQINRGRDTSSRSDAEQMLNAIDRYNAFQGYNPWVINPTADFDIGENSEGGLRPINTGWVVTGLVPECQVLERLSTSSGGDPSCVGADELKASYVSRVTETDYNTLYIYNGGEPGFSTYVCFEPVSGAFTTEARDRCNDASAIPADFPEAAVCPTDSNNIPYICIP